MLNNRGNILTGMTIFLICVIVAGAMGALLGKVYSPKFFMIGNLAVIALLIVSRDPRMIIFVGIPINIILAIASILS